MIGWLQLLYIRGPVFSVAGFSDRSPSSILRKAERQSVSSSDIMNFLLKTNDRRGRRPD